MKKPLPKRKFPHISLNAIRKILLYTDSAGDNRKIRCKQYPVYIINTDRYFLGRVEVVETPRVFMV